MTQLDVYMNQPEIVIVQQINTIYDMAQEEFVAPGVTCIELSHDNMVLDSNFTSKMSEIIESKLKIYDVKISKKSVEQLKELSNLEPIFSSKPDINLHPMGFVELFWNPEDSVYVSLIFKDNKELILMDDEDNISTEVSSPEKFQIMVSKINEILNKYSV